MTSSGSETVVAPRDRASRPKIEGRGSNKKRAKRPKCWKERPVDRTGNTVDFRLSRRRDVTAAKTFFRKAFKSQGSTPQTITLDGYAASHRAVRKMKTDGQIPEDTQVRSSKYLNNLIEQDHRGVKSRLAPMLGFKAFRTAAITIAGVELLRRIHKGQFNLSGSCLRDRSASANWAAVLAA